VTGLHAGHLGVALLLGLGDPRARVQAELAERLVVGAVAVLPDRLVRLAHALGRLLVVDVLELHEGAIAGGEHAARHGLAAPIGADPQLDVRRGQLVLVAAKRSLGLDPDRLVEHAGHLDLGLEPQVGAADLLREGAVEQVLDAVGVVLPAARRQRTGSQQQQESQATHAGQDSGRGPADPSLGASARLGRGRGDRLFHRNPEGPSSLYL
jgi:hypothetical protein